MKFFWGLVIAGIGFLMLGVNLGWWSGDVWSAFWLLWPLIFIVLGLRFLINRDKIFMLASLLLVVAAGYMVINQPTVVLDKLDRKIEVFSESFSDKFESNKVKKLNFKLDIGASLVTFENLNETESGNTLYKLETKNFGRISKKFNLLGENADVSVNEDVTRQWLGRNLSERQIHVWLTQNLPIELDINSGASKFDLDFRNLKISKIDVNSGASKGEITFGSKEPSVVASVQTGASKMVFNIPKGSGLKLRFESEDGLNSKDFDSALELEKRDNHIYQSKNYDTTANKIDLTLSAGVSNIEINQY
jgi:hypothetical protein